MAYHYRLPVIVSEFHSVQWVVAILVDNYFSQGATIFLQIMFWTGSFEIAWCSHTIRKNEVPAVLGRVIWPTYSSKTEIRQVLALREIGKLILAREILKTVRRVLTISALIKLVNIDCTLNCWRSVYILRISLIIVAIHDQELHTIAVHLFISLEPCAYNPVIATQFNSFALLRISLADHFLLTVLTNHFYTPEWVLIILINYHRL